MRASRAPSLRRLLVRREVDPSNDTPSPPRGMHGSARSAPNENSRMPLEQSRRRAAQLERSCLRTAACLPARRSRAQRRDHPVSMRARIGRARQRARSARSVPVWGETDTRPAIALRPGAPRAVTFAGDVPRLAALQVLGPRSACWTAALCCFGRPGDPAAASAVRPTSARRPTPHRETARAIRHRSPSARAAGCSDVIVYVEITASPQIPARPHQAGHRVARRPVPAHRHQRVHGAATICRAAARRTKLQHARRDCGTRRGARR